MNSFRIIYIFAFLIQLTKTWSEPLYIGISSLFLIVEIFNPPHKATKYSFYSFLVFSTSYLLIDFPGLANHSIFYLVNNLGLLILLFPLSDTHSNKQNIRNQILLTTSILYILASFHKLNSDFIFSLNSCALAIPGPYFKIFGLTQQSDFLNWGKYLAISVILLELTLGCLILSRRFIGITSFVIIIFHGILAPLGFTDFGFVTFIYLWILNSDNKLPNLKYIKVGIGFFIILSIFIGLDRIVTNSPVHFVWEGFAFILLSLALWIKPIIENRFSSPQTKYTVNFSLAFVTSLMLIQGLSIYLGLGTAANFSMFSNLTTYGQHSNHLILKNNPFKIFDLQEDIVWINSTDKDFLKYSQFPKQGEGMNIVEYLRFSQSSDKKFAGLVTYKGNEIVENGYRVDPELQKEYSSIKQKLLKFRIVQKSPPIQCRW